MSTKKHLLEETFNKQLEKLIDDIILLYPDTIVFKKFKSTIVSASSLTPGIPIISFKTYIADIYESRIMKKDIEFFVNFNLQGTFLSDFSYLRDIYTQSNDEVQQILWLYLIVLTKLAKKYE